MSNMIVIERIKQVLLQSQNFPAEEINEYSLNKSMSDITEAIMTNRGSKTILISVEHIDDLVQDCSIAIANILEILQSCTKPSICRSNGWTVSITNKCLRSPIRFC